MATTKDTILIIGGTGAQGVPVVKALAADSKYNVRVISRNASSPTSLELAALPGVTIFEGNSQNESTLRKALVGVDSIYVNTNGFAIGEKAEIYWGIRLYELSREFHLKHFVYASLFYASKLGGFDPKYKCGHLDGKGKVAEYVRAQPTSPMAWSVLTSCLYVEGLYGFLAPRRDSSGTWVFSAPLGEDGSCPLIYLDDYAKYARWVFDTPSQSNGLDLKVATEDISWKNLAADFASVTGYKAVYKPVTLDEYFEHGVWPNPDAKIGQGENGEDPTLMTFRENFSGFWNTWKDGLTKRDYNLLDEILPTRVRTIKEWMEKVEFRGERKAVLAHAPSNAL